VTIPASQLASRPAGAHPPRLWSWRRMPFGAPAASTPSGRPCPLPGACLGTSYRGSPAPPCCRCRAGARRVHTGGAACPQVSVAPQHLHQEACGGRCRRGAGCGLPRGVQRGWRQGGRQARARQRAVPRKGCLPASSLGTLCPSTLLLPVPELEQHCQTADGGAQVRRLAADPRWAGCLELRKRKDHFIFTVESTGALPPHTLFLRAVDVLAAKAGRLLQRL